MNQIANLNSDEINVTVDFNNWILQKQFYEPNVEIPSTVLDWRDLSPRTIELGVARETAASICHDGRILSNIISSQVVHSSFGGVVPEIASREHELMLNSIVNDAISEANLSLGDLDAIAVTQGPGLAGALLTGVSFAKGLSIGLNISLIPINHLEAHIFANFLADSNLSYPFICLLISGGHTQLWLVKNMGIYDLLGETRDDAAGEAFDKGSRILGLGYPGGPQIEKISKNGNPTKIIFPRSLMGSDNLEFSFSGLKTSLLYFMDNFQESKEYRLADVAASYQQAIVDCLSEKLARAIMKTGIKIVLLPAVLQQIFAYVRN